MPNIGQQHSIEKSRQLQRNLYLAALKDKQRIFHGLYDRIFRLDILWRTCKEVRENKGSAGIDSITFEICKIVIEPIFQTNFLDNSYGFRSKRDAKQATEKVKKELYKNWYVVDADIQGYRDMFCYI